MTLRALILAGGFGKRLGPITQEIPKPLVRIGGKPILQWQIEWLRGHGIRDVVLAVGYLRHKVFEEIGDGKRLGVRVFYSVEEEPLGTGGAIKNAKPYLEDADIFIVTNGDIITNLDPTPLINAVRNGAAAAIALVPLKSPYGIVEFDEASKRIIRFVEKPELPFYINGGVYAMTREIFEYLPDKGDIETTAFPKLAEEGRLMGVVYRNVLWKSIDTMKDIEEAEKLLATQ